MAVSSSIIDKNSYIFNRDHHKRIYCVIECIPQLTKFYRVKIYKNMKDVNGVSAFHHRKWESI